MRGKFAIAMLAILLVGCEGQNKDGTPSNTTSGEQGAAGQKVTLTMAVPILPDGVDTEAHGGKRSGYEAFLNCRDTALVYNKIPYPEDKPPEGKYFQFPDFNAGVQPGFWDKWQLSPDGKSATFHIRPGVKSAQGHELTSEDVKWTIHRGYALKSVYYFMAAIALNFDENNPIEVMDKDNFKLNSKGPNPLLVDLWTNMAWPPYDSTEGKAHATPNDPWAKDWFIHHCSGFGPYTVESWEPGKQVVWVANPNYYAGPPKISRIVVREVPDSSVRLLLVKSGEVDIATDLRVEHWQQAKNTPGLIAAAVHCNCILHGYMNNLFKPFDDIRVRQAFNYVAPRMDIAEKVFGGLATPWETAYHAIYSGADHSLWPYGETSDYDKAKQLLTEAGYGNGLDVTLSYSTQLPELEQMAMLIKPNLAKVGVNVTLNPTPDASYASQSLARKIPFGLWVDTYIQDDPIYQLSLYMYNRDAINNHGQVDDPKFREIIDGCRAKLTLQERIDCTRPAQKEALDQAGFLYLVEPYFAVVTRSNISGLTYYQTQALEWKYLQKK
jgi:peptide/nickel transport system substrate-binding protein